MEFYPLLFEPNLHEVVWGGTRLKKWKGMPQDGEPIGESWEISAIPDSPGIIANGVLKGRKITEITEEFGSRLLGKSVVEKHGTELPLLVKLIDARSDLSIQVHPNDEMAMRCHNKKGKTEMWYVIDADPGAGLYVGFKERITPEEFARRTQDGTICDVLARHEVKAGDVFYIPSGRVHAICGGILLAEVQESSDVTYRIYDYGRKDLNGDLRELHVDMATQAVDYEVPEDYRTHYIKPRQRSAAIIKSPFFNVRLIEASRPFHRNMKKFDSFVIMVCLSGECSIEVHGEGRKDPVRLREGYSCLIPAEVANYYIVPEGGSVKILETFIDNVDAGVWERFKRFYHIQK